MAKTTHLYSVVYIRDGVEIHGQTLKGREQENCEAGKMSSHGRFKKAFTRESGPTEIIKFSPWCRENVRRVHV
jgi:hypothetical protein